MVSRLLFPFLVVLSALASVLLPACESAEDTLQPTGQLAFSADTVAFDTIFTTLRTVTRRLWVYNRNPHAVSVRFIGVDPSRPSPYTLLIGGDLTQAAHDVVVRGRDSLLVLVRATLPDNGANGPAKGLVVENALLFRTNGQEQRVLLRAFGQNIYLHDNVTLPAAAEWTNDRPHVLYGSVVVPANGVLRLKPGTRVYAHAGAALVVRGTLLVNAPADFAPPRGTANDTVGAADPRRVRFAGDRLEASYATAPGQWIGIVLDAGSQGNVIRYASIQNASVGVLLYNPTNRTPQPDVAVDNAVIRYVSGAATGFAGAASTTGLPGAGLLNVLGRATVRNTLFSDCYEYAVVSLGGSCALDFCTVANFPFTAGVRDTPALYFSNALADGAAAPTYPTAVQLRNSIVWGTRADELFFANYPAYASGVLVENSLLRTQLYAPAIGTNGGPGLGAAPLRNAVNADPQFRLLPTGPGRGDYRLGPLSPAFQRGVSLGTVPGADLLNLPRTATPSLGAYESLR